MTYAADVVGGVGDLHALPLEMRQILSPEEAAPYIYGTKWFCIGVATYNLFIWSLKLNMLFFYQRVVKGLWVVKFIKPAMTLLGVTFVALFTALFAACRPYNRMWTVYPDQGREWNLSAIFIHQARRLIVSINTNPTHVLQDAGSCLTGI